MLHPPEQLQINMPQLLHALSLAMDYNRGGLMRHHQRVALICSYLGEELQLNTRALSDLHLSAIVHDAGVSTFSEKDKLEQFEIHNPWQHCERGYHLLCRVPALKPLAKILLHHHDRWDGQNKSGLSGPAIPMASRIIFLADRVDVLSYKMGNILDYRSEIVNQINMGSGTMFDPEVVEAFNQAARKESMWLDLTSQFMDICLRKRVQARSFMAGLKEVVDISNIFADIIDSKSDFTHRHSRLVATTARLLAGLAGFTDQQQENMYVAGLLHDLGKLSIPDEIIEKPGKLTKEEYNHIKQHTYITYQILNNMDGFQEIAQWAAYHHEKLNGDGYPFRLQGPDLSVGSRIMAVADIFSALVENRPYRQGLPRHRVEDIMSKMVKNQHIDGDLFWLLINHYPEAKTLAENLAGPCMTPN